MKSVRKESYILSLSGAQFRIPYNKQFLDKRCGFQKNCYLGDDYIARADLKFVGRVAQSV